MCPLFSFAGKQGAVEGQWLCYMGYVISFISNCLNEDWWKTIYVCRHQVAQCTSLRHAGKEMNISVSARVSCCNQWWSELEPENTCDYTIVTTAESFDLIMNADCILIPDVSGWSGVLCPVLKGFKLEMMRYVYCKYTGPINCTPDIRKCI